MSHDLHFDIENGGPGRPTYEQPIRGEMDHLPDQARGEQSAVASGVHYIQEKLKQSAHPTVIIFHVLFKGLALFLYIFGGWFTNGSGADFIALSVAVILLTALDFWAVKNVTGRLLVGLRWWNKVEDDSTTWIFESAESKVVNAFDRSVFWTVLYATPVIWVVLLLFAFLRFQFSWLLIVGMALSLSSANVYGYYKCSNDQKARFESMMRNGAQQGAMAYMRSSVMGALTGSRNVV